MSNEMATLFYQACELGNRVTLPPSSLLRLLGAWNQPITLAHQYGIEGLVSNIPGTELEQAQQLYEAGIGVGSTPRPEGFKELLGTVLSQKLCEDAEITSRERIRLFGLLDSWLTLDAARSAEGVYGFDDEADTPAYTKTGYYPLDMLCGPNGMPQEVISVLSHPGVGKTTMAYALAVKWAREIGSVIFIQTELSQGQMNLKRKTMVSGDSPFVAGRDRLVISQGARAIEELERCAVTPDPNRLILWDSVSSFCGDGSSPTSREKYTDLYQNFMAAKNTSRAVIAFSHVRRGLDPTNVSIEAAAGSASVERFSGVMGFLQSMGEGYEGTAELKVVPLKNRWDSLGRPFKFTNNFLTGEAVAVKSYGIASEELEDA